MDKKSRRYWRRFIAPPFERIVVPKLPLVYAKFAVELERAGVMVKQYEQPLELVGVIQEDQAADV